MKNILYLLISALIVTMFTVGINQTAFAYGLETQETISGNTLTSAEQGLIKGKTFEVGYAADQIPIQYEDEEGQPSGISVTVLNHIAKEHGFKVNYTPYYTNDPKESHEDFDIVLSMICKYGHTDEVFDSTVPYSSLPLLLLYKDGDTKISEETDGTGKAYGVVDYINTDSVEIKEYLKGANLVYYQEYESLVNDYAEGNLDGAVVTTIGGDYALKFDNENFSLSATPYSVDMNFYLNKTLEEEYLAIFNKMIENIDSKDINGIIIEESSSFEPKYTLIKMLDDYGLYLTLAALIAVIIHAATVVRGKKAVIDARSFDNITNLPVQELFHEKVAEKLKTAKPNEYEMISIDIDRFKIINQYFGYDNGNMILVTIGNILKEELGEEVLITRTNADHFVFFRKIGNNISMQELIEVKLIPAIKEIVGDRYDIKFSVGIRGISNTESSTKIILDRANVACIMGKNTHNNSYIEFTNEMKEAYENRTLIINKMQAALENEEFKVMYQPKIDLNTYKIIGAEALVRWVEEDGGKIFPDEFIPIFETNGFIEQLDIYMLDKVCTFIAENNKEIKIPKIAVNMSAWTAGDPDISKKYTNIVNHYNIDHDKIEIEITESAMVDTNNYIESTLSDLRKDGFSTAIDDFGTGVSSLYRLGSLEVDVLKFDKVFLDEHLDSKKKQKIFIGAIDIAKALNLEVLAEGVETVEQVEFLKANGCMKVQGYLFEKPVDGERFLELLKKDEPYKI